MATAAPLSPPSHPTEDAIDAELETLLTSFDTNYAWNYGSVKEGLRDLYEKAKREQWNGTTQLAWDTEVDPRGRHHPGAAEPARGLGALEATRRQAAQALPARAALVAALPSSCMASRVR